MLVPARFLDMLRLCSPVKQGLWSYWWKAQAVAYILRFNARTRRMVDEHRLRTMRVHFAGDGRGAEARSLPPGTIAMHVRTSVDKTAEAKPGGTPEMQRRPFGVYREVAERLAAGAPDVPVLHADFADKPRQGFAYPRGRYGRRSLLVNTEAQEVLDEALALAEGACESCASSSAPPWDVYYCTSNRSNEGLMTRKHELGVAEILRESFANLELFLEADAWVCTLASAWCTLIDQLRMTVAGKASAPFVDLMQLPGRYRGRCPEGLPYCYAGW